MPNVYRIAIVGAASLVGKQLSEALAESSFATAEFVLLDERDALGQLETVGEEITFIQPIAADSFERVDFVFFCGRPEPARLYWTAAQQAGCTVIDLSGGLAAEAGVLMMAPWVQDQMGESAAPSLATPAVVAVHPVTLVCALLLQRMQQAGPIHHASVTALAPASEYGKAALDELHQQTMTLLSLQSVPKAFYDLQVAFNAVVAFGESAKGSLAEREADIREQYALLSGGRLPHLSLQLVHVPVFHGYTFSFAVEYERPVTLDQVQAVLAAPHIDVATGDTDLPANLKSIGEADIAVRVRLDDPDAVHAKTVWLWASVDNLELAALNAAECAQRLRRLRPKGKVQ